MGYRKISNYVCCSLDVTIASRIIAFIGIAISVLLTTVFLNDKHFNKSYNYNVSRKTALALGLDWQHFHPQASTADHDDPEGRMISIIVIFYSVAYFLMNTLLFLATIKHDWRCAIPWLVCEFLGCLSKFGALIYHLHNDPHNLSTTFFVGSVVYIAILGWWWIVVFSAQSIWKYKEKSVLSIEMSVISSRSFKEDKVAEESPQGKVRFLKDVDKFDSPLPYSPNNAYALI